MTDEALFLAAECARANSYAPYSSVSVGAALLTRSGKVYTGCNVENASFGATVCAERVAFYAAICAGERDFCAIAICGGRAGEKSASEFTPCGICRQVMREFCGEDFRIILKLADGVRTLTLSELMPYGFTKELL